MTLEEILEAIETLSPEDRERAIASLPPRCLWCGKVADRLCDTPLRGSTPQLLVTCDAHVCSSCSTQSMGIFCVRGRGCEVDASDACPYCVQLRKQVRAGARAVLPEMHRRRCRESARWARAARTPAPDDADV